jgi:hypothetical protein
MKQEVTKELLGFACAKVDCTLIAAFDVEFPKQADSQTIHWVFLSRIWNALWRDEINRPSL